MRLEAHIENNKDEAILLSKALQECPNSGILLVESIEIVIEFASRPHYNRASFATLKSKDSTRIFHYARQSTDLAGADEHQPWQL